MVPGRKAGEFSWRAIRFGATLGGSEETSEDRGSSLLVPWGGGGEPGQVAWGPLTTRLCCSSVNSHYMMSRFLPDDQRDISRKLSSAFPISQIQFSPLKRQFAQMKTSLNASMVNWMTKCCFPVLSTSGKGVTESLREYGLLPA